jgi:hypothetical protein
MRRAFVPTLALAILLAAGCGPTRIPPPPEQFDTVVLASDLAAAPLYADALAAFLRNNWEPVTGADDTDDLTMQILPDGERVDVDGSTLVVRITVLPVNVPPADTTRPDLADGDYAGPDLSRRDLSDPARGQNDPDSLRRLVLPDSLTTGSAVLTATVDARLPDARSVLLRTARILTSVEGTLSYR